ncbi:MAG: hypothetical protein EXQ48_07780 [Acidobacteria bacterium]|nr:hypothetical protein [Acidobacteriota bacterium]
MKAQIRLLAVGLALACSATLGAHHGFAGEYDINKPVEVTGVVSKVEWTNPHARFYVDVKDASGKVTTWNFELASLNSLRRNGWTQASLKVGDKVIAKGYGALASKSMANANAVTLADGASLFAASSAPSVQQTPSR